jgi:hypothetical protein
MVEVGAVTVTLAEAVKAANNKRQENKNTL